MIVVDGVAVPTDVIERSYRPAFRVVAEADPPQAKLRVDPIMPGVSVGHVSVSAGTIGCIVYDKNDGTPLILSNWHVLHGPTGALGDVIVQPGPHDDNRLDDNRLGQLKRSHLGVAGDCAVATIEDRRFETAIPGLGVTPEQLGEPELGDKVVKNGRTTGVTHGLVRRVDVHRQAQLRTRRRARHRRLRDRPRPGQPAGGRRDQPGRRLGCGRGCSRPATADPATCSPAFTSPARQAAAPTSTPSRACPSRCSRNWKSPCSRRHPRWRPRRCAADTRPDSSAPRIEPPTIDASLRDDTVRLDGSEIIPYTHFSLALSKSRRFARWVAWNIDGGTLKKINRNGIPFVKDPRIPAEFQSGNELYSGNRLDRGHLARRADLLWAAMPEAERANKDSFFFTNITPQMDDFNQSSKNGVWGRIEDAVFADVDVERPQGQRVRRTGLPRR